MPCPYFPPNFPLRVFLGPTFSTRTPKQDYNFGTLHLHHVLPEWKLFHDHTSVVPDLGSGILAEDQGDVIPISVMCQLFQ